MSGNGNAGAMVFVAIFPNSIFFRSNKCSDLKKKHYQTKRGWMFSLVLFLPFATKKFHFIFIFFFYFSPFLTEDFSLLILLHVCTCFGIWVQFYVSKIHFSLNIHVFRPIKMWKSKYRAFPNIYYQLMCFFTTRTVRYYQFARNWLW